MYGAVIHDQRGGTREPNNATSGKEMAPENEVA